MSAVRTSLEPITATFNRLKAEVALAVVGRDDGLIPAYSLLGELQEQCTLEIALHEPVLELHRGLERLLDAALPFDEPTVGHLGKFVAWMEKALVEIASQLPITLFAGEANAKPSNSVAAPEHATVTTAASEVADVVLVLDLASNRELLVEFYAEAIDHLQQIESALLTLDQNPHDLDAINSIFRSFHTIKGNAGFLGLVPMHTLAHEVESLLDLVRTGKRTLTDAMITVILQSRDALQVLLQQVGRALEKGQPPTDVVRVSHLISTIKALSEGKETGVSVEVALPVAKKSATAGESSESSRPTKAAASQTVRVGTEKLDSLMNVVGELVIVQSQLQEATRTAEGGAPELQRNVAQLSRITKELQHTALALRMIPVKPLFQKMERLVRDLARDLDKKVHFITSGDDTELDRSVIEEIGDPLVHMVRNALDHGLEPAAKRSAAGKSDTGTVHLRAYHQGSNMVIELEDDGRGIDPEKVAAKARAQGLLAEGVVLSREETFNLILLPGFSTAEKVTSVSGRGVGMDVVKRNIEKLRGKIEISSVLGKGSVFKIKLPLTTAIIDGLIVRVGQERFIVPSTSIRRALRPAQKDLITVQGRGEMIDLHGKLLPLHRLSQLFCIPTKIENPWDGIVMVIESSGGVCALLVDELVNKQEVVIKSLGALQVIPGIAGGAILGDGDIALIFDPASLLNAA